MNKFAANVKQFLLILGDIIALFGALILTLFIRYKSEWLAALTEQHLLPFSILYAIWIVVFFVQGLYDIALAKNNLAFTRRFFESLAINALLALGFFYLIPAFGIAPRTNLFINLIFAALFVYGWRIAANRLVATEWLRLRVLFVGLNGEVCELTDKLRHNPQIGFEPVAVIDADSSKATPAGLNRWGSEKNLDERLKRERINVIILSPEARTRLASRSPEGVILSQELYKAVLRETRVLDIGSFSEHILRRVPVASLSEMWFLDHFKEAQKKLYEAVKIFWDYTLSALLFLFFLVTLPALALAIILSAGWPVFYRQGRIGKNGKKITIIKYRTMVRDAERDGARFAASADPRVTTVGKFLRKTRLDELPQVLNILKGEMSFIGPRPERPEFVTQIAESIPFYHARHLVKPGLTGWAQINYPYASTIEENIKKLQYDLYYIKHRSLALDLVIVLKTLPIVLRLKGR